ncbi:cupin domain-containing protein [Demequina sp. B12]|uniref:cupin domain-containing protein n=1 Tax=Demequina sp. B12 TaxID=2992757 RepID=UPI00237BCCA8|nr:cupin domain-containing protein [Demequina sp. B12]MDE0573774.1 cupin domain-containing protein [Demequina sp. B12]
MNATPTTASALGLKPHPEGGWFRRVWTGAVPVDTAGGIRPAATCIHYLLPPGEESAWHVVSSDELWLWHGPGTLELRLGGEGQQPADAVETFILGPDLTAGHVPMAVVPAGTWQAARLAASDEVLVSCVVSPGFDFADWALAADR